MRSNGLERDANMRARDDAHQGSVSSKCVKGTQTREIAEFACREPKRTGNGLETAERPHGHSTARKRTQMRSRKSRNQGIKQETRHEQAKETNAKRSR